LIIVTATNEPTFGRAHVVVPNVVPHPSWDHRSDTLQASSRIQRWLFIFFPIPLYNDDPTSPHCRNQMKQLSQPCPLKSSWIWSDLMPLLSSSTMKVFLLVANSFPFSWIFLLCSIVIMDITILSLLTNSHYFNVHLGSSEREISWVLKSALCILKRLTDSKFTLRHVNEI